MLVESESMTTESTMTTKDHWYDGSFYDRCIAPNQDPLYAVITGLIKAESTVLDVGCGTGRLAWQLSERCRLVHGIDPPPRNIARATRVWEGRGKPTGVRFSVAALEDHTPHSETPYDYAVVSYVLHELDEAERVPMLRSLGAMARRLILADYRVPRRRGIMDTATEVVEFLAGREHYRGFRSFVRAGGLRTLVSGMRLLEQCDSVPSTAELLVVTAGDDTEESQSSP
jgi:SAM-dependent methyltransferase